MADKNSRVVFVGNIPYDIPEETITEILSRVGRVVSFRLVYDKDLGKPKGFGFAEYADADSADSAVRNLHDFELMGRNLRVDYSNDMPTGDGGFAGPAGQSGPGGAADPVRSSANPTALPPFPAGVSVPADTSSIDVISQTLKQIKLPQLLDIIKDVKTLVHKEPLRATELFNQAPQLGYAVFQCLLLMGLVDARDLTSILENQPGRAGPSRSAVPTGPAATLPVQSASAAGPVAAAAAVPLQRPAQAGPGPATGPTPAPGAAPLSQQQLIEQVLALTPQQIELLPEANRIQIEQLRKQYGGRSFR